MSFETDNNRLIKKKRKEAMFKIASIVHADAVKRCPVDTNRLRRSIKIFKADDKEAIVGSDMDYACVIGSKHSVYDPRSRISYNIGSYKPKEVLSKDGKAHKILKKHRFSQAGKDSLNGISIKVKEGINPLFVTEDHLILTLRNEYLQWIPAKELNLSDKVFRKRSHNAVTDNSNKKKITCVCGKEFLVEKASLSFRNAKYCSQECYHKYTSHARAKGKNWKLQESQKRYNKENPAWNGGSSFKPYDWRFNDALKEKVKKRDNYTCQICGSKKKLVVHHKDWNKQNSNSSNLVTLCASCHGKQKRPDCELPTINLDKFKPIPIIELKKITLERKGKSHLPNLYDFTIDNENSFVCGGILIHNSYVEYGTPEMVKAHGEHDVEQPVTNWEAKRKRGAVGQTLPFLRPAVYFNRDKIKKIMKEVIEKK